MGMILGMEDYHEKKSTKKNHSMANRSYYYFFSHEYHILDFQK